MDCVIPLLNSSHNNYYELRYALRSFERWLNPDRVFLVGGKPNWYCGDHIQYKDFHPVSKESNIYQKLLAYLSQEDRGDFYFCNDDHFLMATYMGLLYKGYLKGTHDGKPYNGSYSRTLRNTMQMVGEDALDFDIHYPILLPAGFDWKISDDFMTMPFGVAVKTSFVYANGWQNDGILSDDHKLLHIPDDIIRYPYFSTHDRCDNLSRLEDIFPDKSKWEL